MAQLDQDITDVGINPLERGAAELLKQEAVGYWTGIFLEVRRNRTALLSTAYLVFIGLVAIFAPLLANDRPFIACEAMNDGEKHYSFPLLASLSWVDWSLVVGFLLLLWMALWRYIVHRRHSAPRRISVLIYLAASGIAPAWGLLRAPWHNADILPDQWYWWMIWCGALVLGVILMIWGASGLLKNRRDDLGIDLTGSYMLLMLLGALCLATGGANFGTLDRVQLDTTDYYSKFVVNAGDGTWAIFPLDPHNYAGVEPYLKDQAPLGPHVEVVRSGGSDAAGDLKLGTALAAEKLSDSVKGEFSADTPVTALRNGTGLRHHDSRSPDFTVVTGDLGKTRVNLFGVKTLGDVIDAMNKAVKTDPVTKKPLYVASINQETGKIDIRDQSRKRPTYWAGTDDNGSDVLARLIRASRVAMSIGFVSTSIALCVGVIFGAIIGYFGGWVDMAGMRIIEVFMAIPQFFLLITIIAFVPPAYNDLMLYVMMIVIGLTSWMGSARFIRAEFFKLREVDYIQAAKACGLPLRSILFKHMLPNGVAPVLVDASFGVASAIFIETGLSYLGFGIKPPEPSWGQMLAGAVSPSSGVFYWWLAIFPGALIFMTVFGFNLIGDALRDAIDPRLKKAAAI